MRLNLLVDMNLSPQWVPVLQRHGWQAAHWSTIGDPGASDKEITDWARDQEYVVFTHDLDFGTMLALTHEAGAECAPGSRGGHFAGLSGRSGHCRSQSA